MVFINWKKEWKNNIQEIDDLKQHGIHIKNQESLKAIIHRHPMSIPKYYLDLINKKNENDPIRKLSIPTDYELDISGDYDTSGESENTKLSGLQHKYKTTALVLTTNTCFMYCRHCFRKRMVGYSKNEIMSRMDQTIQYIQEHKEINNVLLSGGDSFCLSTETIKEYLDRLVKIDHLDFIRFGTRSLVVFPQRIYEDEELLDTLSKYSKVKKIYVVTQFNHPNEITKEAIKGIEALYNAGIIINNQTVLLKGINDDSNILTELLSGLLRIAIHPYYVFQCRPVKYVKKSFQLPLIDSLRIIDETKKNLNGFSKRFKFIMSHPKGKIEIVGENKDSMIFKFHQAKNEQDHNKIFIRKINPKGTWLDNHLEFTE